MQTGAGTVKLSSECCSVKTTVNLWCTQTLQLLLQLRSATGYLAICVLATDWEEPWHRVALSLRRASCVRQWGLRVPDCVKLLSPWGIVARMRWSLRGNWVSALCRARLHHRCDIGCGVTARTLGQHLGLHFGTAGAAQVRRMSNQILLLVVACTWTARACV